MKKLSLFTLIFAVLLMIPALGQASHLTEQEEEISEHFFNTLSGELTATVLENKTTIYDGVEFKMRAVKCEYVSDHTFKLTVDRLVMKYSDLKRIEPYTQNDNDGIESKLAIKMSDGRWIAILIEYYEGEAEGLAYMSASALNIP